MVEHGDRNAEVEMENRVRAEERGRARTEMWRARREGHRETEATTCGLKIIRLEVKGCGQKEEEEEEAMARGKEIKAERVRQGWGREAETEVERGQSRDQTEEEEEGGRGQPWLGCAGLLPGPPRWQVGAAPTWLPAPCAGSVLQCHTEGRSPCLCKARHVCLLGTQQ